MNQNSAQLSPLEYYNFLQKQGCEFFAGVPDSLLKAFCACVKDQASPENFWISANEGAAIGLAIGHHLASSQVPVVYLQNSGLGNTLNPLVSMADPLVYSIPMLLLIGWRGELGHGAEKTGEQLHDEPQHRKQGCVTLNWLEASGIPYEILPTEQKMAEQVSERLLERAKTQRCPVAIVLRKNSFASYLPLSLQDTAPTLELVCEDVIALLLDKLNEGPVVSTTGMISRELFEQREKRSEGHEKDFLVVGAMGHAAAIAQGLALGLKQNGKTPPVYCFDGDGSLLMHMGNLAICGLGSRTTTGGSLLPQFHHIVLNNGAHDSVGGQPTVALDLDIPAIAKACGYRWSATCSSQKELEQLLPELNQAVGPALLEIRIKKGTRKDLGRPTLSNTKIKAQYQAYLGQL